MDWTKVVYRIEAADDAHRGQGTGFAFDHDADGSLLVVTCWHVVREIRRNNLRIKGLPCEVVSSDGDDDLDLAVLRVADLACDDPLSLAPYGASGKPFDTYGYEPIGRPLSGKLGAATSRRHASGQEVPAWDYYLDEGARELEKIKDGYSGAPVCDRATGGVIAVITHRQGTDKGFAIDIANLPRVYPQTAALLADAQADTDGGLKPFSAFRDQLRDGGEGPKMVVLPAGSKRVSRDDSKGLYHDDDLTQQAEGGVFAIGKYPVTFEEYELFCNRTDSRMPYNETWGRVKMPVMNVSYNEASLYTNWLSTQTGTKYRLPNEAEWEYAARAQQLTRYWWGDVVDNNRANCRGCGSKWKKTGTSPVDFFRPNIWGLHDMAGNVWEWTSTLCNPHAPGSTTPHQPASSCRIIRGGSWYHGPEHLRLCSRRPLQEGRRARTLGFRILCIPTVREHY